MEYSIYAVYATYFVQAVLVLLTVYFLVSVDIGQQYRLKMNTVLYIVLLIFILIALSTTQDHLRVAAYMIYLFVILSIGYFLYRVKDDHTIIDTPLAYMSFFIAVLLLVVFSGHTASPLYPEGFLLALLFTNLHAGRKITYAITLISTVSILLIFFQGALGWEHRFRVLVTIAAMLIIPQVHSFLYKRKKRLTKRE